MRWLYSSLITIPRFVVINYNENLKIKTKKKRKKKEKIKKERNLKLLKSLWEVHTIVFSNTFF